MPRLQRNRLRPETRAWPVLIAGLLFGSSCASPAPEPLDAESIAARVADRASDSPEQLRVALSLYDAPPLGLSLPADVGDLDPASDAWWHARALAWNPDVRQTRRAWRAAAEEQAAAGAPAETRVGHRIDDFDEPDLQNDVQATVDLLGLLGLGPAAAERETARSLTAAARGRLEDVAWTAVFAVDRARVGFVAARIRSERLAALATAARRDLHRLELLEERGRLATGLLGRARAVLAALDAERTRRDSAAAAARATLATAAGLPPQAPALDAAGAGILEGTSGSPAPAPSPVDLLRDVPALRTARLSYALAEARLRAAAAQAWPRVSLGPGFKLRPDEFLAGGLVSLDLPWPPAVAAGIAAATERRAAAREAVEDALAGALASVRARRRELMLAREHRARDVAALSEGSMKAWRAARARLSVLEGLDAVEPWLDAFQLRARGVLADIDAAERELLADLAFREAAGLSPGLGGGGR